MRREVSRDGHEPALRRQLPVGLFCSPQLLLPTPGAARRRGSCNVSSAGQHPIDFDDVMVTRGYEGTRGLPAEQAGAGDVHHRSRGATEGRGRHRQLPASGHLHEHEHGDRGGYAPMQPRGGRRGRDPRNSRRRRNWKERPASISTASARRAPTRRPTMRQRAAVSGTSACA